jgi:hypothetical protein
MAFVLPGRTQNAMERKNSPCGRIVTRFSYHVMIVFREPEFFEFEIIDTSLAILPIAGSNSEKRSPIHT